MHGFGFVRLDPIIRDVLILFDSVVNLDAVMEFG